MAHPVVFLHGFLESPAMWEPILRRLQDAAGQVLCIPLPGHAGAALPREWTMDAWVEELGRALPATGRVAFVGHSMGGYVAAHFAARHPERVSGVLLFHSRAGADDAEKKLSRLRAVAAAEASQALYVRGMITSLFAPEHRAALAEEVEALVAEAAALPPDTIRASQEVMRTRPGALGPLVAQAVPLAYYLGDQDAAIPLHALEEELAAVPHARVWIERGIGHMGHLERPDGAASFIREFLSTIQG